MPSERRYRAAMWGDDVLDVSRLNSGGRFHPEIVDTFVDLVG